MKRLLTMLTVLLLAFMLVGCADGIQREDVGLAAGGVAGGVIGHAVTNSAAGTIVGAVGGAFLGREIAKRTGDKHD